MRVLRTAFHGAQRLLKIYIVSLNSRDILCRIVPWVKSNIKRILPYGNDVSKVNIFPFVSLYVFTTLSSKPIYLNFKIKLQACLNDGSMMLGQLRLFITVISHISNSLRQITQKSACKRTLLLVYNLFKISKDTSTKWVNCAIQLGLTLKINID